MSRTAAYQALVERGCLCGTERPHECPIHSGQSDNRGIRAWFEAGMPHGFPMQNCTCAICADENCLIYPNIEICDPKRSGEYRRTLICPRCSTAAQERALVADALQFGYVLNDARVFAEVAA